MIDRRRSKASAVPSDAAQADAAAVDAFIEQVVHEAVLDAKLVLQLSPARFESALFERLRPTLQRVLHAPLMAAAREGRRLARLAQARSPTASELAFVKLFVRYQEQGKLPPRRRFAAIRSKLRRVSMALHTRLRERPEDERAQRRMEALRSLRDVAERETPRLVELVERVRAYLQTKGSKHALHWDGAGRSRAFVELLLRTNSFETDIEREERVRRGVPAIEFSTVPPLIADDVLRVVLEGRSRQIEDVIAAGRSARPKRSKPTRAPRR